eukprot:4774543-Amphidinium_carterae.1
MVTNSEVKQTLEEVGKFNKAMKFSGCGVRSMMIMMMMMTMWWRIISRSHCRSDCVSQPNSRHQLPIPQYLFAKASGDRVLRRLKLTQMLMQPCTHATTTSAIKGHCPVRLSFSGQEKAAWFTGSCTTLSNVTV